MCYLHVGSPQGHAVGGQPQNDDYDVKRGLEELVHLTVHLTECDVAHCPECNALKCVCAGVCPAKLSCVCLSADLLSSSSSCRTVTCRLWCPAQLLHAGPTWSDERKQICHLHAISLLLLSFSSRALACHDPLAHLKASLCDNKCGK